MLKFSIIIPTLNSEKYIEKCINSILLQTNNTISTEIIIVDDCSRDKTKEILNKYKNKDFIKILSTKKNEGPGIARNIGIENATGNWILFLDSDDTLNSNSLLSLSHYINNNQITKYDIIAYNWIPSENSTKNLNKNYARYDFQSLLKNKKDLVKDFIALGMDGSAIYTLISLELLNKNNIRFHGGLHEDIDFIFKVYFKSNKIGIFDFPVYIKNNCEGSIVNTISIKHLEGYFRAYNEIYNYLKEYNYLDADILKYYHIGVIGIISTRLIEIWKNGNSKETKLDLYKKLYTKYIILKNTVLQAVDYPELKTKYFIIFEKFINIMEKQSNIDSNIDLFMQETIKKSWSCYDLHNSVFLAPNEIRTCCKRFFVDNKIKGDVPLVSLNRYSYEEFTTQNILKEKKDLYTKINKGESSECNGCPFLEFKEWGYINKLNIEHISFEYHSVCNMKCIYCSDTYYDGKQLKYNLNNLVDDMIRNHHLDNCNSIVWGGGEPTLDKNFEELLLKIAKEFPNIKQRIITNATVFKNTVKELLDTNNVTITTSIDAGTEETFYKIRKNKHFNKVFDNLVSYSIKKPDNITLKYIVMKDNNSLYEIENFVKIIKQNNLDRCNFQISFDFKEEIIDLKSAIAMVVLYGLLIKLNVRLVFFDDLLRQRLKKISTTYYDELKQKLKKLRYVDILADEKEFPKIIIWGAGIQTKNIIETSHFLKNVQIEYIVDNTPSKIGKKMNGYKIYNPTKLKESSLPILISAVQASPFILEEYKKLGLEENRLIRGLVI